MRSADAGHGAVEMSMSSQRLDLVMMELLRAQRAAKPVWPQTDQVQQQGTFHADGVWSALLVRTERRRTGASPAEPTHPDVKVAVQV
jgi:hypothetical protein